MTPPFQVRAEDSGDSGVVHTFVSPWIELNCGLWSLFGAASILLAARLWTKIYRRYGLWYDDHILIVSWVILLITDALIVHQFATGYILPTTEDSWDDRMHILINISSCTNLVGQSLTKTAFAVTLLRLSKPKAWHRKFLWFCIISMNSYMAVKVILQWAKLCGKKDTDVWYRIDGWCVSKSFRDDFKEGGNIYNIIMDFVFATFPWLLTRKVDMRKWERIGLCAVMSLGMIVAIVSAIRVSWKSDGNSRDAYYIYRNGLSQIWYSSEVAGTIIVQCLPVLRPVLRDARTSIHTKKFNSTGASSSNRRSTTTMRSRWSKRHSGGPISPEIHDPHSPSGKKEPTEHIMMKGITEEHEEDQEFFLDSRRRSTPQPPPETPDIPSLDLEEALSTVDHTAGPRHSQHHARSSSEAWPLPNDLPSITVERPASMADSGSELSFVQRQDSYGDRAENAFKPLSPVPRDRRSRS